MANWWEKNLTDAQRFRLQDPQDPSLLQTISNFPVGAGDIASGLLATQDLARGNYGQAALNSLGLLPFIPSMGGITTWHGSPRLFDKFDLNAPKNTGGGLNKHGIFSSPEKKVGQRYANDFGDAGYLYKLDADVKNPLNLEANQYEKLQSIVGKIDENKKLNEFEQAHLENVLGKYGWNNESHPIEAIKKAGFDSITKDKGRFGMAESELMVFDPSLIKILKRIKQTK